MRELNEQELNQVAGGTGFNFNYNHGTQAQAGGAAAAGIGLAGTQSITGSSLNGNGAHSFAANKSFAVGIVAVAESNAASTSGTTISLSN